jgi:mRNA-degrading endonuclease YafQ of YafQ-DinJ toxin-antitoxin module
MEDLSYVGHFKKDLKEMNKKKCNDVAQGRNKKGVLVNEVKNLPFAQNAGIS